MEYVKGRCVNQEEINSVLLTLLLVRVSSREAIGSILRGIIKRKISESELPDFYGLSSRAVIIGPIGTHAAFERFSWHLDDAFSRSIKNTFARWTPPPFMWRLIDTPFRPDRNVFTRSGALDLACVCTPCHIDTTCAITWHSRCTPSLILPRVFVQVISPLDGDNPGVSYPPSVRPVQLFCREFTKN